MIWKYYWFLILIVSRVLLHWLFWLDLIRIRKVCRVLHIWLKKPLWNLASILFILFFKKPFLIMRDFFKALFLIKLLAFIFRLIMINFQKLLKFSVNFLGIVLLIKLLLIMNLIKFLPILRLIKIVYRVKSLIFWKI
jgi:hypothetical protein